MSKGPWFWIVCIFAFIICIQSAAILPTAGFQDKTPECWTKNSGVCVEMMTGRCPFSGGEFTWTGCPANHICCIPPTPPTTRQPSSSSCGISKVKGPGNFRIVGGWDSQPGEWPWKVSLKKDFFHICGGVVINDHWIVTAAHCFRRHSPSTSKWTWSVVIGDHDQFESEGVEQYRFFSHPVIHPSYNDSYGSHDIALIRVDKPIRFNNRAQPICLPSTNDTFENMICSTTGWGVTRYGSNTPTRVLKELNLPLVSWDKCKQAYPTYLREHHICAGFSAGKRSPCNGDSGGPSMCKMKSKSGYHWVLAGVTSFGEKCALANFPGVFTSIAHHHSWIQAEMKKVEATIKE